MAADDQNRGTRTDDRVRGNTTGIIGIVAVVGLLLLGGWWLLADDTDNPARTNSPTATGTPNSGTGTSPTPQTAPKQP